MKTEDASRSFVDTIHWRESAGSTGPIVLVHGWSADGRIWGPFMARMAGRFRLMVPDLPGHGRTPLRLHEESVGAAAIRELGRWSNDQGLSRAPVVAWAWGTQVVLGAVLEGVIEPTSILLVSPVTSDSLPDPWSGPLWRDWPRYIRSIVRMMTAEPLSPESEDWLVHMMASTSICAAGGIHAFQLGLPGPDFKLPANSLAVVGERDRIASAREVTEAVQSWGAELVQVPGAGHVPFIENRTAFDELFISWTARIGLRDA